MEHTDGRFTIALIYDFDGTLAPGNMQEYDFIPAVGKSNKEFWSEANTLAEQQDADMVLTYMALMIQAAKSKNLSLRREAFQESGRRVALFAGVREWFERINRYGAERGIRILHYINSSGLKEIIEGTEIAHEFRKIYACSFLYDVDGIAYWPAVAVNYTNKTPVRSFTTATASPTGLPWRSTTPTRPNSSSKSTRASNRSPMPSW